MAFTDDPFTYVKALSQGQAVSPIFFSGGRLGGVDRGSVLDV